MHIKVTPIDADTWNKLKQASLLTSTKREIEGMAKVLDGMIRWKNITYYSSDFYYFFPSKILAKKFLDALEQFHLAPKEYLLELKETGKQPSYMYPCVPGKGLSIDEDILAMISDVEET